MPWLSLRTVHALSGRHTLFYQQIRWARRLNAAASCVLGVVFLLGVCRLVFAVPFPVNCVVAAMLCVLSLARRFRAIVHAVVGLLVLATAFGSESTFWTSIGAGNLFIWLLLRCESREAWRVWMQKPPLVLENVNIGSAKLLKGKVRVFHLFVDTPRRKWSDRRSRIMPLVKQACRWMVRNAENYGVKLSFDHQTINSQLVCFEGKIPTVENDHAGLSEFEDFLQAQLDEHGINVDAEDTAAPLECCLLVHFAEDFGREAYAVPTYRHRASRSIPLEYAVVGAWRNPTIYAHEILHLFGADDFNRFVYNDTSMAREWDAQSASVLDRSVMFYGAFRLDRLNVDELTAQCIGWR